MSPYYSADSINSFFIDQVEGHAIFATDTEGIVQTWNKGAERVKGYSASEIIGQYYGILHPDEYQQAGRPHLELLQSLNNGQFETEDWRKRKDGSLFWASVKLTPIFSKEGKHVGYTKITADITKQKELQDMLAERQQDVLEHKNQQLKKINSDLDNFIYTASHDLRSPIVNIEALTFLLQDELKESDCLSEATAEVLQRIIASVNRFKNTIEDLTEISRLQKDVSSSASEEIINIQEIYEDIIADLNNTADLKACFIETNFKVQQLRFSKKNFKSILYNILSNAIKYQSSERDCIINVHTVLEAPYVVLSIRDNGMGMNNRQQEQLFTMFKRFHDHVEGTGVGLYIVKRIVENAEGKIEVASEEGTGTEFKIYFRSEV